MDRMLVGAALIELIGWVWLIATLQGVTVFILTPLALIFVGAALGIARFAEMRDATKKGLDKD